VVKNLLVGEDVTYERKIREIIVASRVESTLSKAEILELYLNSAYLGRSSWGVEMAARSYFGKSAKTLTLGEGAMLAGLLKGPSFFNPDRRPERARERLGYVLGRMPEQKTEALAAPPKIVALDRPRRDSGFHFVDFLGREAKADGIESLTAQPYTVHSTINATLQRDTEAALQEGLAHYEIEAGRVQFHGPEANIAEAVQKLSAGNQGNGGAAGATDTAPGATPAWQRALASVRLPLYDVHWEPAVVLKSGKRGDGALRAGLTDGRILPLSTPGLATRRNLNQYDVLYVRVIEDKGDKGSDNRKAARAQLRVRPTVQGATLVLENKTGRILAMAGSFSYRLSQLNRTSQTRRQPGSAIKPLTYLTALQKGLAPNTLISDQPFTLPPIVSEGIGSYDTGAIGRKLVNAREEDYWTPRNYGHASGGLYTLRRGLENSVNIVTAHLLDGGIEADPEKSLDDVCATAVVAKIYTDCVRYYPFVLGAQPLRMIDLAAFYAAVANEGARPQPHVIDSIEADGKTIYQYPNTPPPTIGAAADHTSFYQLKTILQGVVARGTARAISGLSPYVAGKTGTTEDSVDGWFIGFTNDVTIAVWVGYDNGDGKRHSLGSTETGARVALPIFEPILTAIWSKNIAPKAPLSGPSGDAQAHLIDLPIDYASGQRVSRGGFIEHFRLGEDGTVADTTVELKTHRSASTRTASPASAQGFQGYLYQGSRYQGYASSNSSFQLMNGGPSVWGWR
jgi:penicillin-binding protein 1A